MSRHRLPNPVVTDIRLAAVAAINSSSPLSLLCDVANRKSLRGRGLRAAPVRDCDAFAQFAYQTRCDRTAIEQSGESYPTPIPVSPQVANSVSAPQLAQGTLEGIYEFPKYPGITLEMPGGKPMMGT